MLFRSSGFRLGKFLGIPVYLHPSWFLILFLFTAMLANGIIAQTGAASAVAYPTGAITALLVFATLLAHEYGHALAARHYGIGTERITLFIIGGVAQIREEPRRPIEEFIIAIAGPAVSFLCVFLFGIPGILLQMAGAPPVFFFALEAVAGLNLFFAIFNLIPGFPMDGGRVLRASVWGWTGNYLRSTWIASLGGQAFSFVLIGWGGVNILTGNFAGFMPIILGLFLNQLARTSYSQAQMKSAFDAVRVRDLMRPIQAVVPAEMPIRRVVEDYIYKVHADRFPVVSGQSLLGYISADEISRLPRDQWDLVPAERLARPYGISEMLSPNQSALAAFQKVNALGRPNLPVFNGKQLIGYLFFQDVANYMQRFAGRRPSW